MPITPPPSSFIFIHDKIKGEAFSGSGLRAIVHDINQNLYSAPQIAAFLTACAANPLSQKEILYLTRAMVGAGPCLSWDTPPIVDKHCIGGLPGNRTTPIIVAILAGLGLTIPKTSSRAITSAAGTADVMEVLTSVHLSIEDMQNVVRSHKGCFVWGGAVGLSPVDDDIVRVARDIGLDGNGQMVASIFSKKIAAGSTHIILDVPVGPTAKITTQEEAVALRDMMNMVARDLGLTVRIIISDGRQPIGRGIGPALEARDVVSVLRNETDAPQDLRAKAVSLAGAALELVDFVPSGGGAGRAAQCLSSGKAFKTFEKICEAQGGLRPIPRARHIVPVQARRTGIIQSIDNRAMSRLARLAGAPEETTAGLDLLYTQGDRISSGQAVFNIHAQEQSRIDITLNAIEASNPIRILEDTHIQTDD